ncbi:MAG: restriction endonuclease subunit S [Paludibacteraceae bacterium]|nr:restriction endonuclease subunit S [Paludibacteraceae bacterium]
MVEWKRLGEISHITIGEFVHRDKQNPNASYPVYNGGTTHTGFYDQFNNTGNKIVISARGYAGFVNRVFENYWAGNSSYSIDVNDAIAIWTYVYYYLKNEQYNIMSMQQKGGGLAAISKKQVQELKIPIPSLSEQTRIVGILDTFTASIENLKEQIAQRRKQYEHYRDELLNIEGKRKDIKCWRDFCEMMKGNGVQKADFVESGRGCIHYGQIYTHYGSYTYSTNKFVSDKVFLKARKASKGDIIMTDTSENVEDICKSVAYLGEEDIAVSNHALIIKHKQNPRFLSYSTQTSSFMSQKRKVVVGAKVSGIKPEHLGQINIYLPSLSEQSRIVSVLDSFEASIRNLKAQLKEREKQYEYYRNKLLTF